MSSIFSKTSVPSVPAKVEPPKDPEPERPAVTATPTTPATPETPPKATNQDNIIKEQLKKKQGDKANLMTGGLGLRKINPENLYIHTLGGGSNTGLK